MSQYGRWSFEKYDIMKMTSLTQTIRKKKPKVVINCATYNTLIPIAKLCLDEKVHVIDLCGGEWETKRLFGLNDKFQEAGVIGITGCGSVPGIGSVMVRSIVDRLDSVDTIEMGFVWDSNMKEFVTPFSINTIIWEYVEKLSYLKDGQIVKTYPMETIEKRKFNFVGEQAIFQSNHPENYSMPYYFKENGLQNFKFFSSFPKHVDDVIKAIITLGFNEKFIKIGKEKIEKDKILMLLLKSRVIPSGYKEYENLWALIKGTKNDKKVKCLTECYVPPRDDWYDAGCNIDTGFPAAIVAEMILKGKITLTGFNSMEAKDLIPVKHFFKRICKEGMCVYENGVKLYT
jgi:saccharopine dehydrogenase-like NADP-dependent oxidoreductase